MFSQVRSGLFVSCSLSVVEACKYIQILHVCNIVCICLVGEKHTGVQMTKHASFRTEVSQRPVFVMNMMYEQIVSEIRKCSRNDSSVISKQKACEP